MYKRQREVEPETLLKSFSIVFQDVVLFNNTIMENIRLGRKEATDREVMEAARAARCEEFILRLPDGYRTMVGENGSALSGGERQRLSIARALLKDAPVILMDEATASLDVENETLVQEADVYKRQLLYTISSAGGILIWNFVLVGAGYWAGDAALKWFALN